MSQHPPTHCWFYGHTNGKYACFSNFYPSKIVIDNKEYKTVEHYFQSKKFEGTSDEEVVRNAETAKEAKMLGRQKRRPLRTDWYQVKDNIMYEGVLTKFLQNQDLRKVLKETDDLIICEHTRNDKYWGDGNDPEWTPESMFGKNKLGITLMKVRENI